MAIQTQELTVAEARPSDVGRGMARLDPKDMAVLGVQVGDVILVRGKRATPAKVMPAYPQERGMGTVQIDGITRENAQVGLGDGVQLEKVSSRGATRVVLAPAAAAKAFVPG
ncbi:MAG: AAA family ATPase, partial [Chloroflexi bacterium]|nr:AAA family ATPase [Chloroflexota bacterium]